MTAAASLRTARPPPARPRASNAPITLAAILVLALFMIAPLLWMIGLSLKPNAELLRDTNSVFQAPYTFKNYVDVFAGSGVFR
jgi:multiple sugar transport system permease protein